MAAKYGTNGVVLSRAPLDQTTGARDIPSGAPYGGEWIKGPAEYCTAGYADMVNASRTDGGNTYCDCAAVGPLASGQSTTRVLIDGNSTYAYTQEPAKYYRGERACSHQRSSR